ncbi:MAG: hypothetical protein P8Z00_20845, partial [Anaerolineales bacterium]
TFLAGGFCRSNPWLPQSLIAAIPNLGKEIASTGKACPEHSEWERRFRNDTPIEIATLRRSCPMVQRIASKS